MNFSSLYSNTPTGDKMWLTVLSTTALFRFLVFRMQRLLGGGVYLKVALFKKS